MDDVLPDPREVPDHAAIPERIWAVGYRLAELGAEPGYVGIESVELGGDIGPLLRDIMSGLVTVVHDIHAEQVALAGAVKRLADAVGEGGVELDPELHALLERLADHASGETRDPWAGE